MRRAFCGGDYEAASLVRQDSRLDLDYVYRELTSLCELKESPDILPRLKTLVNKIGSELAR